MLNAINHSVITLNIIIQSDYMLSAVMLSVVAPKSQHLSKKSLAKNSKTLTSSSKTIWIKVF
jgi:hypothetical protein